MKAARIVNLLFVFLFLGAGVVAASFLYQDYQHFDKLRAENTTLQSRHAQLDADVDKRQSELDSLADDTQYIEAVIRTKLNFAKEGEKIFRFEK